MLEAKQKLTQSQLAAVESAPCFARVRVGNVSPIRIQTPLLVHLLMSTRVTPEMKLTLQVIKIIVMRVDPTGSRDKLKKTTKLTGPCHCIAKNK